jgi:hypothetical protein
MNCNGNCTKKCTEQHGDLTTGDLAPESILKNDGLALINPEE